MHLGPVFLIMLLLASGVSLVRCTKTGEQAPLLQDNDVDTSQRIGGSGTGEGFGGGFSLLPIAGVLPIYSAQLNGATMSVRGGEESHPTLGSGDFTVGFLMKSDGQVDLSSATNVIVAKLDEEVSLRGSAFPFFCEIFNRSAGAFKGRIRCSRRADGVVANSLSSPTALDDGRAHYIFFSSRGSELSMMVDGVKTGSLTLPTGSRGSAANTIAIRFGELNSSLVYSGKLDKLVVYSRAFTNEELAEFSSKFIHP